MKRFLLFLVLFASLVVAQAVEPKQVGASQLRAVLEWQLVSQSEGSALFKTFAFPNTSYQKAVFNASDPFTLETDSLGNPVLRFDFQRNAGEAKTIRVQALVNVDFENANEIAANANDFLGASDLIVISPAIKTQALLVVQNSSSDLEKLVLLTDWVHSSMTYDEAYWGKSVSSERVFQEKRGVCVEYSHLLIAMMRSQNIPSRLVAGFVFSGSEWDAHAWVEAAIGGKWVAADPTYGEAIVLDGTHVVFAFGRDHSDIKEEVTQGVEILKPSPVFTIEESTKPDFFSLVLNAPEKTGSNSAETIAVKIRNKATQTLVAPVLLIVPDRPPELAVRLASFHEKLVLLRPNEEKSVSWVAVFPQLQKGFSYNFSVEAKTMGANAVKTVSGEVETPSSSIEKIEIIGLDYALSNELLSLSITVKNSGSTQVEGHLSASIGGEQQRASVLLQPFEQKPIVMVFTNAVNATSGEIILTTDSQTIRQPFSIEREEQKPEQGFPLEIAIAAAAVVAVALLVFFKARRH